MSVTLYRKYRPQRFSEVVGQDHIKTTLQSEIKHNALAHAFLFCGPRGIGKTSMARIIAKVINCENRKEDEVEPCNECDSCKEITAGRSLDIIEMDAASHTKVEEVRESIIANSKINTVNKKYKVFIIDEVHMLSNSSFNALLKTLEEPPKNVVFVLATTEVHKIPVTIISRCQRFDFKKVKGKDLVVRMAEIVQKEGKEIEEEVLERIVRISGCYVRDSLSLLGQVLSLPKDKITVEDADTILPRSDRLAIVNLIEYISKNQTKEAVLLVNTLYEEGVSLKMFFEEFIEVLREMLLESVNVESFLDLGEEEKVKFKELSTALGKGRIVKMINLCLAKKNLMTLSDIEQLPLELAVIELTQTQDTSESSRGTQEVKVIEKVVEVIKEVPAKVKEEVKIVPVVGNSKDQDLLQELKAIVNSQEEEKAPEITEVSEEMDTTPKLNISLEEVQAKWHDVMISLTETNHSLHMILHAGQLIEVREGKIKVGFKFGLHKDRVMDIANKTVIEDTFLKIYGGKLVIEAVVDESLQMNGGAESVVSAEPGSEPEPQANPEIEVDGVLDAFGGSVVS